MRTRRSRKHSIVKRPSLMRICRQSGCCDIPRRLVSKIGNDVANDKVFPDVARIVRQFRSTQAKAEIEKMRTELGRFQHFGFREASVKKVDAESLLKWRPGVVLLVIRLVIS